MEKLPVALVWDLSKV
jgi:hypothetical protein